MAQPCQGYLEAHAILYLPLLHNSGLCMDPTYPEGNSTQFPVWDCSEFYDEVEEPIPPMLESLWRAVDLCMHTRRSHTGILYTLIFHLFAGIQIDNPQLR